MNSGKNSDELLGYIRCPFHDDGTPSYAIYADHAYCYGCGEYESADAYQARTGISLEQTTIERTYRGSGGYGKREDVGDLETRIDYWHRTLMYGPRSPRKEWFVQRGFSEYNIQRFRFGHTGDHFVIPIINENDITGFKWRVDPRYCDPNLPRYRNSSGSGVQAYRPNAGAGTIVVCEGELDAAFIAGLGYDAITTTSGAGSISRVVLSLRATGHLREAVYVATDPDEAGEKAARDLASALPRDPYRAVWTGGGDISDYLNGFEPIERHKEMRRLIENARPYSP